MDPRYSAQDVVRCSLCKTEVAPLYCNVCHTHLCKDCIDKHFSDKSKVHNVVPLEQFLSTLNYPKCVDHPTKQCELHCKQCDVPFCTSCISSKKHLGHEAVDIMEDFEQKKEELKRDLQELEKIIFPKYQESAAIIVTQRADQLKNSQELRATIEKHGEALHREIDLIIQQKQSEIDKMNHKHLAALEEREKTINGTIAEIKQVIQDLKSLLDTSNVCLVSKYKSRIEEFKKMPSKVNMSLQTFTPHEINREQLLQQFGSFSPLSTEAEEKGYTLPSRGSQSSQQDRSMLDVPCIITELATEYKHLYSVSCLSDEEIWTSGNDKILKLYNLRGELVKSVQTKSGNRPRDLAVTQSGDLVYTDLWDRTINLVSNTQVQTLITLQGWKPLCVCSTSSGDLLVTMNSDDKDEETKVVRYSGSTEKQSIQWDDQDMPLYTPGNRDKYLVENRNLDICVSDCDARAVVVVSASGKFRFRYIGPSPTTKKPFDPIGITTDSHARILTADSNNDCIHIIDQDGHFLRYIDNCDLSGLWGLCVDSSDNLFVAALYGKMKKIQYYRWHF